MLDLEYADFHKTLESDRVPPKVIKDFDGSSHTYTYIYNAIQTHAHTHII